MIYASSVGDAVADGAPDVGDALERWAAAHFGGDVSVLSPATPIGDGFDAQIWTLQLGGDGLPAAWREPLVVRVLPSIDRLQQARDEAAAMAWCAARGYPVPEVLAVLEPGEITAQPAQVMLRVPGHTMLDEIRKRPWRARRVLRQLATLHLSLHSLPTRDWPLSTDPNALADRRLGLTRNQVRITGDDDLARALSRAEELLPSLVSDTPVVCHGDFHPLNVLVGADTAHVIDWTDAGLGDLHGDVSRTALLFELAAIAANTGYERAALRYLGPKMRRYYLDQYGKGREVDPERLARWEALHLLHGWAQVSSLHAGAFDGQGRNDDNLQRVPEGLATELRDRFWARITELA